MALDGELQVRADKARGVVRLAFNGAWTELPWGHALALAEVLRLAYDASLDAKQFGWRSGDVGVQVSVPGRVLLLFGKRAADMPERVSQALWRALKAAALLVERRAKRERIIADARAIVESSRNSRADAPHPQAFALSQAVVGVPRVELLLPKSGRMNR